MLAARTFPGNPFDGHILSAVLEQATNLTQDLSVTIKQVVADLGFRGKAVDADNPVASGCRLRDRLGNEICRADYLRVSLRFAHGHRRESIGLTLFRYFWVGTLGEQY